MKNETNVELVQVEAPAIVPTQEAEVLVQTTEDTGAEDQPVKSQAVILADRGL